MSGCGCGSCTSPSEDTPATTSQANTTDSSTPDAGGDTAATPCDPTLQSCANTPPCKKATITKPLGSLDAASPVASWLTSPCHHFDFQGVVSGSPGPYVLAFQGTIDPAPPYGYQWKLDAAAGTLTNGTTPTPTHTAPASPGEGTLTLTGVIGGTPASCTDHKKIKIYQDHLARDRDNFGVGISCGSGSGAAWSFTKYGVTITESSGWNCFGSVDHAYNGSGPGYTGSVNVPLGWSKTIYDVPSAKDWSTITKSLHRGDVVSFWSGSAMGGYSAQHAHTSLGGATMYGGNNEPAIQPTGHPATWRWFETTSETYYNNVNSNPRTKGLLTRVIVYKKP